MRLALLVCDHVAEPFVWGHGDYPLMFKGLLGLNMDPHFVCDNSFPDIEDYDAFIVTGSKRSVYENESWIQDLLVLTEEVSKTDKKYVGICFGHQVIGEAMGGKVTRAPEGYLIGVHENRVTERASWMEPSSSDFNILMLCQDQITMLPQNTRIHASSPLCRHAMISINNQFLGIQGHPEFTKGYNRDVFTSRKEKIGAERVEEAIKSLTRQVHTTLLASWIKNFLFHSNSLNVKSDT